MASNIITPIKIQSIDVATIGAGAWSPIGNPLEGALSFIRITNDSNTDVIISFNKVDDNLYIPATKPRSIYFQANATPTNYTSKLRKHTIVYVRGTAGIGNVFLEGVYNE